MNKPFKEHIIVVCTSSKELEAFKRYKEAKKDANSYSFKFDISKENDVKIAITDYIK